MIKAADQFHTKQPAERDVADRLHLPQDRRVGWMYLSTVLDDFSQLHHRLEAVHQHASEDVTDTLDLGPQGLGLRKRLGAAQARAAQRQQSELHRGELAEYIEAQKMRHVRRPRSTRKPRARSSAGTRP